MKPFILLIFLSSALAYAGDKGNGISGKDGRFERVAGDVCPALVQDPDDSQDLMITLNIDGKELEFVRKDVIDYCCENIAIGPACFAKPLNTL